MCHLRKFLINPIYMQVVITRHSFPILYNVHSVKILPAILAHYHHYQRLLWYELDLYIFMGQFI